MVRRRGRARRRCAEPGRRTAGTACGPPAPPLRPRPTSPGRPLVTLRSCAPGAAWPEGDIVERARGGETAARPATAAPCLAHVVEPSASSSNSTSPARVERPVSGRRIPAIIASTDDLPAPLGPRIATVSPWRDVERDIDVAVGDRCLEMQGHSEVLRVPRTSPITNTATTTSTRESATAASGSTSRCR